MTYDIIYADPPWKFSSNSKSKPGRNPMRHYPCMTDQEIADLPVREWANSSAMLFMWTTAPMLERSIPVIGAWGFKYVSNLVWVKERIGTGFWVRNRHEHILIGKRGKFPCPRPAPFSDSVIDGGQRQHSRKPISARAMIQSAFPDASRLEMFAREPADGWDAWGNETDKFSGAA